MEDASYPSAAALEAMRTVMRELTSQLALLNSHFDSADLGTRREIDPLWWKELQAQAAHVLGMAGKLP